MTSQLVIQTPDELRSIHVTLHLGTEDEVRAVAAERDIGTYYLPSEGPDARWISCSYTEAGATVTAIAPVQP